MPEDDAIRIHGREIPRGVDEGFPFHRAAPRIGDVEGIRAHPLCGNLKRKTGPGAGLKEKIDDGFTAEGGDFFYGSGRNLLERFRGLQNGLDIFRRKIGKPKDMFVVESVLGIHTILSVQIGGLTPHQFRIEKTVAFGPELFQEPLRNNWSCRHE